MDYVTGLTWERDPPATAYSLTDARARCAGLSLAGFTDWRLPTLIELLSIVDYSKYNPSINSVVFLGTGAYWTSSPVAGAASQAWHVNFGMGNSMQNEASNPTRVRCVR